MFKRLIQKKLERYVRKYFRKHPEVKLVIVTGSVGKTSTKVAIGTVLSEKFRIRMHEGNHNAELSAPLAILGVEYPSNIRSIGQWRAVFKAGRERIKEPTDVDVIVQEVGSDHPGEVPHFGTYATPDIAVVTAVSAEHMEFFVTLDAVAAEELAAANFAKLALINRDDIDGKYAQDLTNGSIDTYGTSAAAEYHFLEENFSIEAGHTGKFVSPEWNDMVEVTIRVVGEHNVRPAIAAGAVGVKLGMTADQVAAGLAKIKPVAGRMNPLRGVEGSIILDDTYNSSPLAVASALNTLYSLTAPQRIAVLGSMNELGPSSPEEHRRVGELCDRESLDWVVTVGEDANKYLAPAAELKGCQVRSFKTALEAGAFVHQVLEQGAIVLFKGSQGGIFLEEGIKIVLHETEEESQLVRQSSEWLAKKQAFFQEF